jgi:hypothetical protein
MLTALKKFNDIVQHNYKAPVVEIVFLLESVSAVLANAKVSLQELTNALQQAKQANAIFIEHSTIEWKKPSEEISIIIPSIPDVAIAPFTKQGIITITQQALQSTQETLSKRISMTISKIIKAQATHKDAIQAAETALTLFTGEAKTPLTSTTKGCQDNLRRQGLCGQLVIEISRLAKQAVEQQRIDTHALEQLITNYTQPFTMIPGEALLSLPEKTLLPKNILDGKIITHNNSSFLYIQDDHELKKLLQGMIMYAFHQAIYFNMTEAIDINDLPPKKQHEEKEKVANIAIMMASLPYDAELLAYRAASGTDISKNKRFTDEWWRNYSAQKRNEKTHTSITRILQEKLGTLGEAIKHKQVQPKTAKPVKEKTFKKEKTEDMLMNKKHISMKNILRGVGGALVLGAAALFLPKACPTDTPTTTAITSSAVPGTDQNVDLASKYAAWQEQLAAALASAQETPARQAIIDNAKKELEAMAPTDTASENDKAAYDKAQAILSIREQETAARAAIENTSAARSIRSTERDTTLAITNLPLPASITADSEMAQEIEKAKEESNAAINTAAADRITEIFNNAKKNIDSSTTTTAAQQAYTEASRSLAEETALLSQLEALKENRVTYLRLETLFQEIKAQLDASIQDDGPNFPGSVAFYNSYSKFTGYAALEASALSSDPEVLTEFKTLFADIQAIFTTFNSVRLPAYPIRDLAAAKSLMDRIQPIIDSLPAKISALQEKAGAVQSRIRRQ